MPKEIPVYLFTGFLEGGKTTFIQNTLIGQNFNEGDRALLLVCEEGIEEYDPAELAAHNIMLETIEEPEELTTERLMKLHTQYKPQLVLIEYNGTWKLDQLFNLDVPRGWTVVQIVANVDASTFDSYLGNMRAMMMEQVSMANLVIFNRCTEETKRGEYRRIIKANNRMATIVFEKEDGSTEFQNPDDDLPYKLDADVIDIGDDDFGIFYIDASDNPDKYVGKTVHFKGMVYKPKNYGKTAFVPGRHAMTCCVEDIAFVGFKCVSDMAAMLKDRQWVEITGKVDKEYYREFKGEGPVIYATKVVPTEKPKEEVVLFN
ncbi:MAG: GTP-binding protein [Clostridium sp.]|nr:GTP-binding protein [Clostridium sp.]